MLRGFKHRRGFTFIELLLIMALVGSLSSVALVKYEDFHGDADASAESGLVSNVNVGIVTYGTESLTTKRTPLYPPHLDDASVGKAAGGNPFFSQVLIQPVTSQWEKLEPLRYKGPTDTEYLYEPSTGEFRVADATTVSMYGNILGQTSMIVVYDSGTIVSLHSDLAYIPDFEAGIIEAILASGVRVFTDGLGGATATLPDGTEISIADIMSPYTALVNDYEWSSDYMQLTSDYAYVGYGYAIDGGYQNNYITRDSGYDPATNTSTYNNVYNVTGSSSQVGLNSSNGYIWETEYNSNTPTTYSSSYTSSNDGSYSGSYQSSSDLTMFSNSGNSGENTNYGYTVNSDSIENRNVSYAYDANSRTYSSREEGTASYSHQYEYTNGGVFEYSDDYTYSHTYTRNDETGNYANSGTFEGRTSNYSYISSYDSTTKIYTYEYTDNLTGRTSHYIYQR